jgi:hypothetical protein
MDDAPDYVDLGRRGDVSHAGGGPSDARMIARHPTPSSRRVRRLGEPLRSTFREDEIRASLAEHAFGGVRDEDLPEATEVRPRRWWRRRDACTTDAS